MWGWIISGLITLALTFWTRERWSLRLAYIGLMLGGLSQWAKDQGHLSQDMGDYLAFSFLALGPVAVAIDYLRRKDRDASS